MSHRVIAIGDIHGCAAALRKLIELIDPQSGDVLIPLGDCVDRGPDSRDVI
jgi:serine/threonine protein phosphatase 1